MKTRAALLPAGLLSLLLAWPAMRWMGTAWLQSPLDRQGALFALAALVCAIYSLRRRGQLHPLAAPLLGLAVALLLLGLLVDVNLLLGVALVGLAWALLLALGAQPAAAFASAGLLLLALPTSTFLLGQLLGNTAMGVLLKWPLAAALGAFAAAGRRRWRAVLPPLLLAWPLAWACLLLDSWWTPPAKLAFWLGIHPTGSLAALLASLLLLTGVLYRPWKNDPASG